MATAEIMRQRSRRSSVARIACQVLALSSARVRPSTHHVMKYIVSFSGGSRFGMRGGRMAKQRGVQGDRVKRRSRIDVDVQRRWEVRPRSTPGSHPRDPKEAG